ncbi:type II toxin-antitoxin system RelE/ParE family toxin [Asticcacaulis benevestitus]|uniref:Plasmid stabilization protein n=1 Tax=Asticcacaulis benevestitus DSM 16100 = ATCC BAA-896 TaxID=1121022 RepID=V4PBS6_9CAUL|nr:type II toxin-antitoxin system RelE/ParE family toxin [Asticcacaulis benevestitus]ESQ91367.1 hypothetical protein ABENE_10155 [Asticcacaulis benevestitus DSM 16100 = ATCC BAA-896]
MSAKYRLSRRALADPRHIFNHSTERWGEARANLYIQALYETFGKIAAAPDLGVKRQKRAWPFLMIEAQQHFIIYDVTPDAVLILTIQHQRRDIERLIQAMRPDLLQDIAKLSSH